MLSCRVLLATIRDQGLFPCPRCLVPKSELQNLGYKKDSRMRVEKIRSYLGDKVSIARHAIYGLGLAIRSTRVEALLRDFSGIPTTVGLYSINDRLVHASLIIIIFRMHL